MQKNSKSESKVQVVVWLTPEVRRRLRIEAAITNKRISAVIADLIVAHIPDREPIAILTENLPEAK